jgi:hypothetical protein
LSYKAFKLSFFGQSQPAEYGVELFSLNRVKKRGVPKIAESQLRETVQNVLNAQATVQVLLEEVGSGGVTEDITNPKMKAMKKGSNINQNTKLASMIKHPK